MSVQYGQWNFAGTLESPESLQQVAGFLAPYGPDGGGSYQQKGVAILYRALLTAGSGCGKQPSVLTSGSVLCWDGRLDNRMDLVRELQGPLSPQSPDLSVVAAAFETWGTASFARLLGDWALSIWVPEMQTLYLAKDVLGVRPLYYRSENHSITWCTLIAPIVQLARHSFALDQEYIAGWLSQFPAAHLTPYAGVHAVPPSSYVSLQPGRVRLQKYWDFNPGKTIRYRRDADYEEHFRLAFAESVRRRLASDHPIVAELSGGMDSASIVCMADRVLARSESRAGLLTLSYLDDSEPSWDERAYVCKVEEKRGRVGRHIQVTGHNPFQFELREEFTATPDACGDGSHSRVARESAEYFEQMGVRVVLSGIGGDEVTGGVLSPEPELADLLAGGRWREFAARLTTWALYRRKPVLHLLRDTLRSFLPPSLAVPQPAAPWFALAFGRQQRAALLGYEARYKILGARPSFQANLQALGALRRQLATLSPSARPSYERRYPFLDRDLLEFLYAIPREQLVRPGERRSLLRRALAGIVPDEVLNRKRKGFVVRAPVRCIGDEFEALRELSRHMLLDQLGMVDAEPFLAALEKIRRGTDISIVPVMRTLLVEYWLQNITRSRVLDLSRRGRRTPPPGRRLKGAGAGLG